VFFPAPVLLAASLVFFILTILPLPASAWNIPGHMLSGIIAYQVLRQENPPIIEKVKAVLEKHPGMQTNGRRGFKTFRPAIVALCRICRRQGGRPYRIRMALSKFALRH
jgi:sec-independent protein translocase protein TatA